MAAARCCFHLSWEFSLPRSPLSGESSLIISSALHQSWDWPLDSKLEGSFNANRMILRPVLCIGWAVGISSHFLVLLAQFLWPHRIWSKFADCVKCIVQDIYIWEPTAHWVYVNSRRPDVIVQLFANCSVCFPQFLFALSRTKPTGQSNLHCSSNAKLTFKRKSLLDI